MLEEAVLRIRLHPTIGKGREAWGTHGFCPENIFTDFDAIQVTLGVVMRAIMSGRIDSKTAGRLLWELQIASKLLRLQQRVAKVAMHRESSRGVQNIGEPIRAAEQILRPHADDLEDRKCNASSASGWRLDGETVTPKQGVIVIERAA